MIACEFGAGEKDNDYFASGAAEFQRLLKDKGINSEVVARVYPVITAVKKFNTTEKFYKLTDAGNGDLKHKRPGSKVVFRHNDKGQQTVSDAYHESWKKQTLNIIKQCAKALTAEDEQIELEILHDLLLTEPPKKVLQHLEAICEIKDTSSRPEPAFLKQRGIRKVFHKMVMDGKALIENPLSIAVDSKPHIPTQVVPSPSVPSGRPSRCQSFTNWGYSLFSGLTQQIKNACSSSHRPAT